MDFFRSYSLDTSTDDDYGALSYVFWSYIYITKTVFLLVRAHTLSHFLAYLNHGDVIFLIGGILAQNEELVLNFQ